MIKKPLYLAMTAQLLVSTMSDAGTKVIVKNGEKLAGADSAVLIEDYGSFKLFELDSTNARNLASKSHNISVVDEMNELLFEAFRFDTQRTNLKSQLQNEAKFMDGNGLQIIQFVGPIKQNWLDTVERTGVELIHYVANNGYIVWANEDARAQLNSMVSQSSMIQFSAPYTRSFKMGSTIAERMSQDANSSEVVNVNIQLADSPYKEKSKHLINNLAERINAPWNEIMNFHSVRVSIKVSNLNAILDLPDSYWVNEYFERTLSDEVQNQILVADFAAGNAEPAMPGYADFLNSKGFPTDPSEYPIVDVTDDGIGTGNLASGDPTFHEGGNINNPNRLNYIANCTGAANGESIGGHGHLNTNIVGGFESRVGFPYIDPNGYIRTQGVNPFTRLAGTRIFGPGFDLSACGNTDAGLIQSVQDNGAQIMSNSWGCSSCAGSYDDSSQAFDVGVRDADLTEAGNQELIMVFAAGNSGSGAGTVGTPGNGKNMITVGASENFRPTDEGGNWNDGCGIGPTGADNAMDVIGFSSRGPSPGGRTKPEVIAPGTHIHGTASTSSNYNGTSVCDEFRPGSQTTIAASSGTSHSTPAVAGVASLAYYWLENPQPTMLGSFGSPSPAMMKAYLVAHPTYLTGVSANDDLPSNSQGYGMPNMSLMFDDTPKYLYDQSIVFDNTGEDWTWVGSAADPAKPVRIVMTYTDQAGAQGTSPQVNNLDLSVDTSGSTYLGNVFTGEYSTTGGTADSANNYEAVFLPAGTATDITITVSAANIAGDGIPNTGDATDQDFALVCYNCAQDPTFTLTAAETSLELCAPDDATYSLSVDSILGFTDDVTLSSSGLPAGATESFSNNPVTPAGTSDYTISSTGSVAAGSHVVTINGVAGPENKSIDLTMNLYDAIPGATTLTAPADAATGVDLTGTAFAWDATPGATGYTFELSDTSDFSNIIETATTASNGHTSAATLSPDTAYYWRVYADNVCGGATPMGQFSFMTLTPPGECSSTQTPNVLLEYDFESGLNGWSVGSLTGSTEWVETGSSVHSGAAAMFGEDVAEVSDQILTSPEITIPAGELPVSMSFWNKQGLEENTAGCFDGGFLEISTDSGASFTQVAGTEMLTDPYDGPISSSWGSPAGGQDAWCGDDDWFNSVVNFEDYAGQSVIFRFRVATDTSIGDDGWYIDDVRVQSCVPNGNTFTVGGNVTGLEVGNSVTLQNNGGDDLAVNADGSFTFATAINDGGSYAVTVLTQPSTPEQVCSVSNGSGFVSGANVTNVDVSCVTTCDPQPPVGDPDIIWFNGFQCVQSP